NGKEDEILRHVVPPWSLSLAALTRKRDTAPGPCAFVNRKNDLNGPTPLTAIDQRRPAFLDRLHEIGELPGVAGVRDARRVARPTRGADLLRETLANRGVIDGLRREVPAQHVLLFNDGGTAVTV